MNLQHNKQVVIFLGGEPGTGKAETVRWIQKLSEYGFVLLTTDIFASQWPQTFPHYFPGEEFKHYPQYDKYFKVGLDGDQVSFEMGPDFDKFYDIRFVMFEYMLKTGHNIIVKDTFEDDTDLDNYLKHLGYQSIYIFRLTATDEEIADRRTERYGKRLKHVERNTLMQQENMIINTTGANLQDVAKNIIKHIADNPR